MAELSLAATLVDDRQHALRLHVQLVGQLGLVAPDLTQERHRASGRLGLAQLPCAVRVTGEALRLVASVGPCGGARDQLAGALERGPQVALEVLELRLVRQRVIEAAPVAEPASNPSHGSESLARQLPPRRADVVEADRDLDELVRGEVIHVVELGDRPPEVPLGDARERDQPQQCTGAGQPARDLGIACRRLGLVEGPDHAVQRQQRLVAVVRRLGEARVGATDDNQLLALRFRQPAHRAGDPDSMADLAKDLADHPGPLPQLAFRRGSPHELQPRLEVLPPLPIPRHVHVRLTQPQLPPRAALRSDGEPGLPLERTA